MTEAHAETRWAIGSGVRYTRLSLEGERADLWETGLAVSYAVAPWLNIGGEATYGWFDSREGRSGGWLMPHFHAEVEVPLGEGWEVSIGAEVGIPGGDEGLVGNHWEVSPGITVHYERNGWFAEAGASFVFTSGRGHHHAHEKGKDKHGSGDEHAEVSGGTEENEDHESEEHEHHGAAHGHDHSPGDFHDVVDPHGERELHYHAALGIRLLDEHLSLEGRFHGVHVTSNDTPDRDYLRAGLRVSYALTENWGVRTEVSVPITDARRNQWQASVGLQVSF